MSSSEKRQKRRRNKILDGKQNRLDRITNLYKEEQEETNNNNVESKNPPLASDPTSIDTPSLEPKHNDNTPATITKETVESKPHSTTTTTTTTERETVKPKCEDIPSKATEIPTNININTPETILQSPSYTRTPIESNVDNVEASSSKIRNRTSSNSQSIKQQNFVPSQHSSFIYQELDSDDIISVDQQQPKSETLTSRSVRMLNILRSLSIIFLAFVSLYSIASITDFEGLSEEDDDDADDDNDHFNLSFGQLFLYPYLPLEIVQYLKSIKRLAFDGNIHDGRPLFEAYGTQVSVWMCFLMIEMFAHGANLVIKQFESKEITESDIMLNMAKDLGVPAVGTFQQLMSTVSGYYGIFKCFINDILLFVFVVGFTICVSWI